jgi:hypothetical protein
MISAYDSHPPKGLGGGYLSRDEVNKVQDKMGDTKKKLDSLKDGLLEVGNQILDYKDLYSASVESDTICEQMLTTLDYTGTKAKEGEQPDNVGKILGKLKDSLDKSLRNLSTCINPKNLTDEDYKQLSRTLVRLTKEQSKRH